MTTKLWVRILRPLAILVAMVPLAYAAWYQLSEVREALVTINWRSALLSWVVLVVAQPLMGLISWQVLRTLRQDFPYLRITSLYFLSQAAKYLPGGIWAFPGRVIAYQAIGVDRAASVISLVQEVAALFLGAAGIGLIGLSTGIEMAAWVRSSLWLGVAACMSAALAAGHPTAWKLIGKIEYARRRLNVESLPPNNLAWLPRALLPSLGFWLLAGLGFRWLAASVSIETIRLTYLQAASIFCLAWCAGFVIFFAPAGLGVREAALTALLRPYLPIGEALGIALAARLWWTLGEALFILLAVAANTANLPDKKAAGR